MTPRKMTKAEMLAFDLICEPPIKPTGAYAAQVPWRMVTELRAEFERMGYDWQKYAKQRREKEQTPMT